MGNFFCQPIFLLFYSFIIKSNSNKMYPSKAIFSHKIKLESNQIKDIIDQSFKEIYSPKQTLEELIAELEVSIQKKLDDDPALPLALEKQSGLKPRIAFLKISNPEELHLSSIIESKGKNLIFDLTIEYVEVFLVGYIDDQYLITNIEADIWNDYAEVIYIPRDSAYEIKKMKYIEMF